MRRMLQALLPELGQFQAAERARALKQARAEALEAGELLFTALALVAVTALTKAAVSDAVELSRWGMTVLNFVVALPLLIAVLLPVHLRRLRRGLRRQRLRLDQG